LSEEKLSDDILRGAGEIGEFLGYGDDPRGRRRTYYVLENRVIPAGKLMGEWIASKREIRARLDEITSGE
jgi:hypothetical protein